MYWSAQTNTEVMRRADMPRSLCWSEILLTRLFTDKTTAVTCLNHLKRDQTFMTKQPSNTMGYVKKHALHILVSSLIITPIFFPLSENI